jgi:hypothetical protein
LRNGERNQAVKEKERMCEPVFRTILNGNACQEKKMIIFWHVEGIIEKRKGRG